jgi:hypothetical protein
MFFLGIYSWFRHREVTHSPGIKISQEPEQMSVTQPNTHLRLKNADIEFLADYSIQARILSIENYYLGSMAKVSPVDLALGWGPMSDTAILENFKINQGDRFYFYTWRNNLPISVETVAATSANVHIIPANAQIEKLIGRFRRGQLIKLVGKLVQVKTEDGEVHKSSLSRTDTGPGACEILYVERAEVIPIK